MKKILALALAFVMVMGLASVAFADYEANDFRFSVYNDTKYGSGRNQYKWLDGNSVFYEDEDGYLTAVDTEYEKGDSLFIKLYYVSMTADKADRWKVKGDWRVGGDLVDSTEIVYKKYVAGVGTSTYDYFVEI